MAISREAIVICLDVGPHMRVRAQETDPNALEQAVECINWILQRKIFTESKDEFAVVLFGTNETDNPLADDNNPGSYSNISFTREFQTADWNLVKYIQNDIPPSGLPSVPADFVDAMTVSLDLLISTPPAKKYSAKQLVLFSNLGAPFADDQVDQIAKAIKNSGIDVVLFGPRLYLSDDDEGIGSNDGNNGHDGGGAGTRLKKTAQQELGERYMTKILNEVDGLAYSFSEGLSLLSKFSSRAVRPTPWKCNIELGERIKIPICMYVKTKKAKIKQSWKWSHAEDPDAEVTMQKAYHKKDVGEEYAQQQQQQETENDGNHAGPSTKPKFGGGDEEQDDNDDGAGHHVTTSKEVEKEDLIKVYNYGTTAVPLDNLDLDAMKYKNTEKCLKILTFIDSKQAKRQYFLGDGCYLVFSEQTDLEGSAAFLCFWRAMRRENATALVRYAYSARSSPRLGVLIPTTTEGQGCRESDQIPCFMFVTLPFAEDCRMYEFPSLNDPKLDASNEQLQLIDDLITSMDLTGALVDENGRRCEAYNPTQIVDPSIQHTYACLAHRALHENQPLPPADRRLVSTVSPLEERMQLAKPVLEKMRGKFELKPKEDKKAKRTANDIFQPGEGSAGGPPLKKYQRRGENHQGGGLHDSAFSLVITSVRPVEEYTSIVDEDRSVFQEASDKLSKIISQFIFEALGNQFYGKAEECVAIFRRKSIELSKPGIYNNWITQLKQRLIDEAKNDFLVLLADKSLGLINDSECSSSDVSAQESKTFFEKQAKVDDDAKKAMKKSSSADDEANLLDELE